MLLEFKLFFNCNLVLSRSCSGYVSRMRHLMRLKEDDDACREALKSGNILVYHKLAPLLQKSNSWAYKLASLKTPDLEQILEKVGKDKLFVNESILLGCTDKGEPQFSLDVGALDRSVLEQECRGMFVDLRKAFFMITRAESTLVAKGQALLRWHQTNGFCSATGQPTVRNQSGSFRVCQSSGVTYYPKVLKNYEVEARFEEDVLKASHKESNSSSVDNNIKFSPPIPINAACTDPQTSNAAMAPVVIVLVSDGSRCLLARQAMFPPGMYSALSGFCDMGESVEEALHRELAEEVGLEVENLHYSGSQHWPFPQSSCMLACHATVNPDKTQVNIDKAELEDARWFTYEEITEALQKPLPSFKREAPVFWIPPAYAIANQLIQEWANQQQLSRKLQGFK